MGKYFRKLIGYRASSLTWNPEHPRDDQLVYSLSKEEIRLEELNLFLDEYGFPKEAGRLPRMIDKRPDISYALRNALIELQQRRKDSIFNSLSPDKRRTLIIRRLARTVALEW